MQALREITFGGFRLDLTNECLWQGTRAISLRPKAFAVLRLLLEHPGQLVNKQQVLDAVWPGTFVGDAVLKDNIRQLREALDDDAGSPSIETAHRRGYRFIGKLSQLALSGNGSATAHAPISERSPKIAALASSAAAIGVLGREGGVGQDAELVGSGSRGRASNCLRHRGTWNRKDHRCPSLSGTSLSSFGNSRRPRPMPGAVWVRRSLSAGPGWILPALPVVERNSGAGLVAPTSAHLAGANALAGFALGKRQPAISGCGCNARADAPRNG
jgi:DNA-binding winged helix-turn-helix (wHTH) protein